MSKSFISPIEHLQEKKALRSIRGLHWLHWAVYELLFLCVTGPKFLQCYPGLGNDVGGPNFI